MLKKLRLQFANILTIINLILGLIAIILAIKLQFVYSAIFILIAALTDRLDGIIARKLNIVSDIGKYLDSNSDLISFGVAPALLIYLSVLNEYDIYGIIVTFVFIICGAFRLARYNSLKFDGYYVGVPITIAGALLAVTVFIQNFLPLFVLMIITLILSYSMVCTIKVKKV